MPPRKQPTQPTQSRQSQQIRVSVLTPTYNRRPFLPLLLQCYKSQTFPLTQMEWIVLDDGSDCVEDFFKGPLCSSIPNLRYIRTPADSRLTIGAKRNILRKEAIGDICISMDDDDFYPPERVAHVVYRFAQQPKIQLAGSSEMYFYFHRIQKIYRFDPVHPSHSTHGPLAWRLNYGKTHAYDETVGNAEEPSFLDQYTNPMIQLDSTKSILVLCHRGNTYDKYKMIDTNEKMIETQLKLSYFIRCSKTRALLQSILDKEDLPPSSDLPSISNSNTDPKQGEAERPREEAKEVIPSNSD